MTRLRGAILAVSVAAAASGCGWHGLNSLPLPGTKGSGPGAYTVQAQMPDVHTIKQNSRVRVNDVTVGNVTKIERQGWHALVTMSSTATSNLPANATATVGQTSLLGSLHIELAPPNGVPATGQAQERGGDPAVVGRGVPLHRTGPGRALVAAQRRRPGPCAGHHDALSTAFTGREQDLRSLIGQLDKFVRYLNDQTADIIAATDSLNKLAGQFAEPEAGDGQGD